MRNPHRYYAGQRIAYDTNWKHAAKLAREWDIRQARELLAAVAELVLDACHIGNLGALPPAPRLLVYKAEQLNILTREDYRTLIGGDFL